MISVLLVMTLQAGGAFEAVPGFPPPVSPPKPLSNIGGWLSPDDYPSAAFQENRQGTTVFKLTIDTAGRVDACRIVESSGHADLDETSCRVVSARARFTSAQDAAGKVVPGYYSNRFRWIIRQDALPPAPSETVVSYVVQPNGEVSDCLLSVGGQIKPTACPVGRFDAGYMDAGGNRVARRVRIINRTEVLALQAK